MINDVLLAVNKKFTNCQKIDTRIYNKDMSRDERRQQRRDYKLRAAYGLQANGYRSFHGLRVAIYFGEYLLTITKMGTVTKLTNYSFIAQDFSRLRADDEKRVSSRTPERWISRYKKTTDEQGNPLIIVTPKKTMSIDKKTGLHKFKTAGMEITIPNPNEFIKYLARLQVEYELLRNPSQDDDQAEQKVIKRMQRKAQAKPLLSTGKTPLGDNFAGVGRQICGLFSYTNTYTKKDITDVVVSEKQKREGIQIREVEKAVMMALKKEELLVDIPNDIKGRISGDVQRVVLRNVMNERVNNPFGYARACLKRIVSDPETMRQYGYNPLRSDFKGFGIMPETEGFH